MLSWPLNLGPHKLLPIWGCLFWTANIEHLSSACKLVKAKLHLLLMLLGMSMTTVLKLVTLNQTLSRCIYRYSIYGGNSTKSQERHTLYSKIFLFIYTSWPTSPTHPNLQMSNRRRNWLLAILDTTLRAMSSHCMTTQAWVVHYHAYFHFHRQAMNSGNSLP